MVPSRLPRGFWTLTGSPTLLESEPLLDLALKKGLTPHQTVYGLCQLCVSLFDSSPVALDVADGVRLLSFQLGRRPAVRRLHRAALSRSPRGRRLTVAPSRRRSRAYVDAGPRG